MYNFAQDQHILSQFPLSPELMFDTNCDILLSTSAEFNPANMGWSTLVTTHLLAPTRLQEKLPRSMFDKVVSYLETHTPPLPLPPLSHCYKQANRVAIQSSYKKQRVAATEAALYFSTHVFETVEFGEGVQRPPPPSQKQITLYNANHLRATRLLRLSNPQRQSATVNSLLHHRCSWKPDDDTRLLQSYLRHQGRWREMARELKFGSDDSLRNRLDRLRSGTGNACAKLLSDVEKMNRVNRKKRTNMSARRSGMMWTSEEDMIIIDYVLDKKVNGKNISWGRLAKLVRHRTKQAVRNRSARLSELGTRV